MSDTSGTWHDQLKCHVIRVHYDWASRTGQLEMPAGECCDMRGCLDFFRGIDDGCENIYTFASGQPDTVYHLEDDGSWQAFDPASP